MKKFLLLFGMVLVTCSIVAQAPQAFKYQAIARDVAGNILSNRQVSIKIIILQGDADGPAVYQETHTATTNNFGLINLDIGDGRRTTDG
ncbi:MAG: Vir protein, partial [Bacteroidales bacterium]|nr:Vir protein [Bacteroidales bacterium]